MLRSSGVGAEPATPKRNRVDLDTSSEFLSLKSASQTKSSRLKRGLNDSSSNTENTRNVRPFQIVDVIKCHCKLSCC